MVPFGRAVDRIEVAVGDEEEVLAVPAERGPAGVVPGVRDREGLLAVDGVEIDPVGALDLGLPVGDPAAVRGPGELDDLAGLGRGHDRDRLGRDVDEGEPLHLVVPEDLRPVGRPADRILVGVAAGRELARLARPVLVHEPDLLHAAPVGDESDRPAVGRPLGRALVDAGRHGQVPDVAELGRDREDVAAGAEEGPLAVGADLVVGDAVVDLDDLAAPGDQVVGDDDRHAGRLLRGQVEGVEVAAVLEGDVLGAERGELDVELGEGRELPRRLGGEVVDVEVHPLVLVAVGEEVDPVPAPHGDDVQGRVGGDVLDRLGGEVVDPDVVGHAAPVPLPGPELPEDAVVGELGVVRRERAEAAAGQRQALGRPAVLRGEIELSVEIVPFGHAGPEDDPLPVVGPAHDQVVRAHAVRDVVADEGGRVGQTLGRPSPGRDEVDFAVAVVLAGEGDRRAVGREPGEGLVAFIEGGQLPGDAARERDRVEVAGVAENDLIARDRGKAQDARFLRPEGQGRQGEDQGYENDQAHCLHRTSSATPGVG